MHALLLLALLHAPTNVVTDHVKNDDGRHIQVGFDPSPDATVTGYEVYRTLALPGAADAPAGPDVDSGLWIKLKQEVGPSDKRITVVDEVPKGGLDYKYAVRAVVAPAPKSPDEEVTPTDTSAFAFGGPDRPVAAWFDWSKLFMLVVVIAMLFLLQYYTGKARRYGKKMYIRRIPGIDAMEEAIGRSTEMGRPVLYVAGVEEIQDIQTIAGLLILGHVAEMAARYDTEIKVPCVYPMTMVLAEEIVRQGYYNAGRPDAHRPQNIQFISSEQFAFCAGVSGMMLRDKPATNIFLGRFYAESLILAETGYVNRAVQIAGTAEITQLPFFIAACDYTIIGEELYAVSAYLSREPRQLSALKATDLLKIGVIAMVLLGAILNTWGVFDLGKWILPS